MKSQPAPSGTQAFTIMELLVIVAILALLAGLLLPALQRAKQRSGPRNCVNNLKQIGQAFQMWSSDNDNGSLARIFTNLHGSTYLIDGSKAFLHFQGMSNELNTPKILICPGDNRTPATDFADLRNDNLRACFKNEIVLNMCKLLMLYNIRSVS